MNKIIIALLAFSLCASVQADLIISQYVETESGTTPKAIELWNTGGSAIDFSVTALNVLKGVNGAALASDFTLNAGTLAAGAVMVIGTSDVGTYLDNTFGVGVIQFHLKAFTYNGDDALQIQLNSVVQDTFGTPGSDPGSDWAGSGVSTANQNIELKTGITTGDVDGWTDPSTRFSTVSTTPSQTGGLAGFGVVVPEPSTFALFSLGMFGLARLRRKIHS